MVIDGDKGKVLCLCLKCYCISLGVGNFKLIVIYVKNLREKVGIN